MVCPRCSNGATCGGHGVCDFTVGKCKCDFDYGGVACCGKHFCPEDCGSTSHGYCNRTTGRCQCRRAWTGPDCLEPMCGTHGVMLPDGSCRGDSGWYPPIKGGICERVGRLCRPDIHCVSDRSVYDTCNKRADGCSSVGACLCSAGYGGLHCNEKLEPTGEQIQRYIKASAGKKCPIVDRQMRLRLAIFLTYSSSRSTAKKFIDIHDLLTVFRARSRATETEGKLRIDAMHIMKIVDMDKDGKLCVNEFLFALIQKGEAFQQLMHRAYMFLFAVLDYDGDGQASFQDILWTKLKAKALDLALKSGKSWRTPSWFVFCNEGG